MEFLRDFKAFAIRGNVIDLAVAVIIGAAFGKIISSLVDGIIMPMIGLMLGGINIASKNITIGNAVIKWGLFLQTVLDFTIIAFSIFVALRVLHTLQRKRDAQPVKPTEEILLLREIRDLLRKRQNT